MQCSFQEEIIFEKVGVFSQILVWVMKIYPYAHPLLHTPLSSTYDSFVELTDRVNFACLKSYSLIHSVLRVPFFQLVLK